MIPKTCEFCGAPFLARRAKNRFCGHSCAFKATRPLPWREYNAVVARQSIAERADRRRGTGAGKSYVKLNGRHEHRLVMEEQLGRPLSSDEIVHHVDENKRHNDPSNLQLTDRPAHGRLHNSGKKRIPRTACKRGHALVEGNIQITSIGRRRCLTCERKYQREWKRARREEAAA